MNFDFFYFCRQLNFIIRQANSVLIFLVIIIFMEVWKFTFGSGEERKNNGGVRGLGQAGDELGGELARVQTGIGATVPCY